MVIANLVHTAKVNAETRLILGCCSATHRDDESPVALDRRLVLHRREHRDTTMQPTNAPPPLAAAANTENLTQQAADPTAPLGSHEACHMNRSRSLEGLN